MQAKKSLLLMSALIFSSALFVNAAQPNSNEQSELNADEVEYDMNTGVITATGNVLLKYGDGTATGARAVYNINTQEAHLNDNVIVVHENIKITCNSLSSDGRGHMQADGNVYAEQKIAPTAEDPDGDFRTFNGEHVDYYPDDRKHVVIPSGGITKNKDGTFTANYMEGWLDDEYYIGTGNAHLVSPPRNLEAGGDRVDYYARDNGKAILSGNAWAYQNNNTIKGNRLIVYLADNNQLKAEPDNSKASGNLSTSKAAVNNSINMSVDDVSGDKFVEDAINRINKNFNQK